MAQAYLVSLIALVLGAMSSGKRATSLGSASDSKRALTEALQECSSKNVTRTGLAQSLMVLHDKGLLKDDVLTTSSASGTKGSINQAMEAHAKQDTEYGPIVQTMPLQSKQMPVWEFIHPMAFVWYLCKVSKHFRDVMLAGAGKVMEIIIYIDACDPANPLRPERTRKLECIYWAFKHWPAYLLSRTGAWLVFGYIRTSIVDTLPGGHSALMARVLKIFFTPNERGHHFGRGILIENGGENHLLTAQFGGFLADDDAHTDIAGLKGAAGHDCD